MSSVLLHLRRLAGPPPFVEDSDAQLLERFLTCGETPEGTIAFEALLERHGAMVLAVCRRLLRDNHQVEDAFQATFLILVKKAGSIARRGSVGSWLHGVARRVALRARTQGARRQVCEREGGEMRARASTSEPSRDDLSGVVDEEVQRLPDKYRTPLVLCYLEGKTNEEAARQLGCPPGTIFTRLSRGREMLRSRLARRGVSATALGTALLCTEKSSAALAAATFQQAVKAFAGKSAGSPAVAALVAETLRELAYPTGKALLGILLAMVVTGVIAGGVALGRFLPASPEYPRRLLAVHIGHCLFAEPVQAGPKGRDIRALIDSMGRRLHVADAQVTMLDDAGPEPLTKPVIETAITDYLAGSRSQDRVILFLAGNTTIIGDQAYIVPFEGELHSPDSLISFAWLYERLKECKGRQKVLILETCRLDPRRGLRRPGGERMSPVLDRWLRSPPEGVEVWACCSEGENSLTADVAGGSLFLEQMFEALEGGAGRQIALGIAEREDSLPISRLAAAVNEAVEKEGQRRYKIHQSPRVYGGETPTSERFDPREPPCDTFMVDRSTTKKPFLHALHRSVALLDKHDLAIQHEFRGAIDACKQQVLELQRPLAAATLELREALEDLELEDNAPGGDAGAWAKSHKYLRARLRARIAFNHEYNYVLSDVRTDSLPTLPPGHGAWRLVHGDRLNCKGVEGKEAKKLVQVATEMIDELDVAGARVPWRKMAARDHILAIGLTWQTAP